MFYLFESLHLELMSQIQQNNPKGNFYENVCFKPRSERDTFEQLGHRHHSHTTSVTDQEAELGLPSSWTTGNREIWMYNQA